jgi:hypothetical protein
MGGTQPWQTQKTERRDESPTSMDINYRDANVSDSVLIVARCFRSSRSAQSLACVLTQTIT